MEYLNSIHISKSAPGKKHLKKIQKNPKILEVKNSLLKLE